VTTYDFPRSRGKREFDDPTGRQEFLAPRRRDLDPDGAHAARATTTPRRRGRAGGPAAPPSGRTNLWLPIGPNIVISGQATGLPRVTGRIRALAVHDGGERMYAGAANGGVWYSPDGGRSWQAVGGFAPSPTMTVPRLVHRHTCGSLLVRFRDTVADDEVFVGTGEAGTRSGQPGGKLGGIGILSATGPANEDVLSDPWTVEAAGQLADAAVYRMADEPGGSGIVAATSVGLFRRGATAADPWTREAGTPFDYFSNSVTSVAWTPASDTTPERLWAWISAGADRGLWVKDMSVPNANFARVITTGATDGRGVIAAATPPTTVYLFTDRGKTKRNALFKVTSGSAAPTAKRVGGVPNVLRKQGHYDIALAVHPTNPAQVLLGGSYIDVANPSGALDDDYNGAIYSGTVSAGSSPSYNSSRHIGIGVHPDVHDLVFVDNGARLYAACDGGVFRSDDPTRRAGFYPCNDGASVIQANYLAVNPRHEGYVVVGLQDNGIVERVSGSVWRHTGDGDGGGVVFDPLRPDRYVRQFYNGTWTAGPLDRTNTPWDSVKKEREASAFYSTPAGIRHTRGAGPGAVDVGQLLIGTTRVWISENFGSRWRTLPRGRDAVFPTYKPNQDKLSGRVRVCRWQSSDEAWILTEQEIIHLGRTPGSDTATSVGTWTKTEELLKNTIFMVEPPPPEDGLCQAGIWTDLAVNLDVGGVKRGARGAIYVGATGDPSDATRDTLYWFDGSGVWFATNLRNQVPGGVPAPVTAIVADPAHPEMVYVGTTVGVWQGTRTITGATATWHWEPLVTGLPEACVEDLALFDDGGVRLLRAAVVSRGVWELRLGEDVEDLTYLRVHDDDMRYRPRSVEVARNLTGTRSWHGSPDIRPRVATVAPPAPTNLPWRFNKKPGVEVLRRFQSALRSRFNDPRFRANGIWDRYFDECLRDNGAPVVSSRVTVNQVFYDNVMTAPHSTAEAWGPGDPTEADLLELTPTLAEGDLGAASVTLPPLPAKVDVVVHRRGLDSILGSDVRVTLLRWLDPTRAARPNDPSTWFGNDITWRDAMNEVLDSVGGTTSAALGPGWSFMGTTAASRRKTVAAPVLDNVHTGVATFDLDLTGLDPNTVVLLVAVIRADGPSDVTTRTLANLALENPHVAVRSLRIHT
jgi:hypothetical protein